MVGAGGLWGCEDAVAKANDNQTGAFCGGSDDCLHDRVLSVVSVFPRSAPAGPENQPEGLGSVLHGTRSEGSRGGTSRRLLGISPWRPATAREPSDKLAPEPRVHPRTD